MNRFYFLAVGTAVVVLATQEGCGDTAALPAPQGTVLTPGTDPRAGTNTGNGSCTQGACVRPGRVVGLGNKIFRVSLDYRDRTIEVGGNEVIETSSTCRDVVVANTWNSFLTTMPVREEESTTDASGALHVHFSDGDPTLAPRVIIDDSGDPFHSEPDFTVRTLDLTVLSDGHLTAMLALDPFSRMEGGSAQSAAQINIEGPLFSYVLPDPQSGCPADADFVQIPVGDGGSVSLPCKPSWTVPGLVLQPGPCAADSDFGQDAGISAP